MSRLLFSGHALFALVVTTLAVPLSSSPAEEIWETPVALIEEEHYSAALESLDSALAQYPTDSLLLRLKGYVLFITDRDVEAVPVLEAAVAADASDLAARYYLAQALAYAGRVQESISDLEDLIALDPSSEYAVKAREWLPQLRPLQSQAPAETFDVPVEHVTLDNVEKPGKRWTLVLQTGLKYDSNVPASSDHPQSSWASVISGFGSYDFLRPSLDNTPFRLGVSSSAYQLWYFKKELSSYNVTGYALEPYASYKGQIGPFPFQISLNGSWEVVWLDGSWFNTDWKAGSSLDVFLLDWLLGGLKFQYTNSTYDNDTPYPEFYSRDGNTYDGMAELTAFLLDGRLTVGLGGGMAAYDTKGSQYEALSPKARVFAAYELPYGFNLSFAAEYQGSNYYQFSPDPTRLDHVWTLGPTLRKTIWEGLSASVSYTFITAVSSQTFAEYQRHVVDFGLTYEF